MNFESLIVSNVNEQCIASLWNILLKSGIMYCDLSRMVGYNTVRMNGKYTLRVLDNNVINPREYLKIRNVRRLSV